ncbi:MAG: hypothetical protein GTO45_09505 [Candidatus Aminicenantes bacterium]|nr:hypothetical protein [Candidatus Aminicenantes bacterium]NIM79050.1 hypothetical protein [Candidatus Aminicenantes bacterium]NIN18329.1 hypothetical protein [Candidatus Aminicenantes bacterium]NIN42216.1 hypothetical protein [Candidatus Aminicenantes bacterium]NIN84982.1 hypothetical protein [Candidatus Aminicenantes bacterium]
MVDMNSNNVTRAEMEQYFAKMLETHLQKAVEDYVERNEIRLKELGLVERVIRVEEELKSLREMSEIRFDAMEKRFGSLQREMNERFEAMNGRFEALQREMNARFEVVDKCFEAMDARFEAMNGRFEAMNGRFEALQREMSARFEAVDKRFEAMDKRFTMIQWMIGILVGIPAITITIIQLLKVL